MVWARGGAPKLEVLACWGLGASSAVPSVGTTPIRRDPTKPGDSASTSLDKVLGSGSRRRMRDGTRV